MRITDSMISSFYTENLNTIKERMAILQKQIATGTKIEKPSDSPLGSVKLMYNSDQLGQLSTFMKNIKSAQASLDQTISAMNGIQSEVVSVIEKLTELGNPINHNNLDLYADKIDSVLQQILNVANSKAEGKYIFGGTDQSGNPYGLSADQQTINQLTSNGGYLKAKVSSNVTQKINVPGADLFGTIVSSKGTLDKDSAVGTVTTATSEVFDNMGNSYQLQLEYMKTDTNTYRLRYDVVDSGGISAFGFLPPESELVFNPVSGRLESVDGAAPTNLNISIPDKQISFSLSPQLMREDVSNSISISANQKMDIFNHLKMISRNLRDGILPTSDQLAEIEKFNSRIIGKQSEVGNTINQFGVLESMMSQQSFDLQVSSADINGVDIVKSVIELQNQEYLLQISQKLAATILPKSLLDYL